MRREPPITLRGAAQLLGHYERPWVDRLDRLLGGAILAVGASALFPPLATLAPIFGWVDQKTEAAGLLRQGLDWVQSRVSKMQGYERVELMAAAHTMIVVSAALEVLREALPGIDLSEREQQSLVTGQRRNIADLLTVLYLAEVPAPRGHLDNTAALRTWAQQLYRHFQSFITDLRGHEAIAADLDPATLADQAVDRYQSHLFRLATTIPDFAIWTQLGEHATTRAKLEESAAALVRLESLLTGLTIGKPRREVLSSVNRAVLALPVVRWPSDGDQVVFPTIEDSYVNPRYRLAVAGGSARPADESWWKDQSVHDQIDVLLAGQFTTFDATRRPLLLLGHPGGGKSMLTKVLAARLPAESYTVVRVPLRQVGANAPLHHQIEQALDLATNGRLRNWSELAEDGSGTIRVVLLDGLDELLQATTHDRSNFLQEAMEFQRVEATQDRPVMVVVTSRTVVAERVEIPPETPVIKLEEFDDDQVKRWLKTWNRANADATASGRLRAMTVEEALVHPALARQPLLLLMLAIYRSDPNTPTDIGELSLASLYQNLLRTFAVREVNKRSESPLRDEPLRRAVNEQLYRLAIAAIGMFNRGRQDITEAELGADLRGLEHDDTGTDTDTAGQRVLGEFFFIHAAEARLRSASDGVRRCYEFLHATFGEYLIARLIVDELAAMADAAFGGPRGPREPADDLLHTLLSHQTLASRQPILEFARELIRGLPEDDQGRICRTLEVLAQRYDRRADTQRFPRYRPLTESTLRRLAAYSANLILLRAVPVDDVPVNSFAADYDGPLSRWSSTVNLWRAGLDFDGWKAMLDTVGLSEGRIRVKLGGAWQPEFSDLLHARLLGDARAERQLRIGAAFCSNLLYYVDGDSWVETMGSWLIPAGVQTSDGNTPFLLVDPPAGTVDEEKEIVLDLLSKALIRQSRNWSDEFIRLLLEWVMRNFSLDQLEPIALAVVVAVKRHLATSIPALDDPGLYDSAAARWIIGEYPPIHDSRASRESIAATLSAPGRKVLVKRPNFYSISVVREDGPVPIGSVAGPRGDDDHWFLERPNTSLD